MDSEDFEQIPWSGLVTKAQPSVDPKWYAAGGVIGAIVIVVLAMRLFSSPATLVDSATVATVSAPETTTVPTLAAVEVLPVVGAVSEADLMAIDGSPVVMERLDVPRLFAEWFVTDFFTRDGSTETVASLEAVLDDEETSASLPHLTDEGDETFVEWARAFDFTFVDDDLVEVSVAYRTVHRADGGFVRDPVRAVIVGIADWGTKPTVTGVPKDVAIP